MPSSKPSSSKPHNKKTFRPIVPSHASCQRLSDAIRKKTPVPDAIYKAHVPEFVGRNGELAYLTIPITKESCERVADAIVSRKEKVPRQVLLAHVPKYVTHEGKVVFQETPENENDYIVDLENNHWVGIEGNHLVFGTYNGEEEEKTFQSMFLKEIPTEMEAEAIGELLAAGIEPGTAQSVLRDLQRAKAKAKSRERQHGNHV